MVALAATVAGQPWARHNTLVCGHGQRLLHLVQRQILDSSEVHRPEFAPVARGRRGVRFLDVQLVSWPVLTSKLARANATGKKTTHLCSC